MWSCPLSSSSSIVQTGTWMFVICATACLEHVFSRFPWSTRTVRSPLYVDKNACYCYAFAERANASATCASVSRASPGRAVCLPKSQSRLYFFGFRSFTDLYGASAAALAVYCSPTRNTSASRRCISILICLSESFWSFACFSTPAIFYWISACFLSCCRVSRSISFS